MNRKGIQVNLVTKKGLYVHFFEDLELEDISTVWIRWIGKKVGEQRPVLTVNLSDESPKKWKGVKV